MECARCRQDNPPQARFCLKCGAPLTLACSTCGTELPLGAGFCFACGRPVGAARSVSPDTYTPEHLAEKILTSKGVLEGERKQVTVLFADLKGSMELLADRDPEEARKILDPVLEHMMEAVHRYEGTVNQVMGDGIMALFGAPLAHEDHAMRACYAALRMQDAVGRYAETLRRARGLDVQIRVGLNSGEVVVRSIGSDLRMDYSAIGQTTHLAARMEQLARPGTTLLTADTLRLAEGYVEVRPLGPVPVKGLADPVETYELRQAGATRSRLQAAAARGFTRFVGRDAELDHLRRALDKAAAGHGQIVALVGEPGVGKSRLVWEFTHSHRTHGWLALESLSVSYGKATSYLPLIDLLKTYFKIEARDDTRTIREKVTGKLVTLDRALEEAIPAVLTLLDALPEDSPLHALDPLQRRARIMQAIRRLLLRESQVQPLLLVFEDLHWIDPETQEFLDNLVDSLPTARLLLLVDYRPEYQHGWGSKTYYVQLRLDPLSPESAEELLVALLGGDPVLHALEQLLIERTEGNPFFLEETIRTLVETQVLTGERGAYQLTTALPTIQVPATVQAVLAARIDRLPPEEKTVLQCAAVIGKDVPFVLLQAIAEVPEPELRRRLGRLQAAEFLYEATLFPELEYTFKHALTNEVAYGGLLHERRKALHIRVVEAIERLFGDRVAEQAEALARHAVRGEVWEKAVDYLSVAGAKAFARAAFSESVARHEEALERVSQLPTSPENLRRAIDVRIGFHGPLFVAGEIPRLLQLHQEAEQLALRLDDQRRLAVVSSRMSAYCFIESRHADGVEYAERALRIATSLHDSALRVTALYPLGLNHLGRGEHGTAIDLLTRIVDGPDAEVAKQALGMAASAYTGTCGWLAWCHTFVGNPDRALAYVDRGVESADGSRDPLGQAMTYTCRGLSLVYRGDFTEALASLERGARVAETNRLLGWLPTAYSMWGWGLAWAGQAVRGLPYLEQAAVAHERVGIKVARSQVYWRWAEGLLLAGEVEDARRTAARALDVAISAGDRAFEAHARHLLGEVAAAGETPDFEFALRSYDEAKAIADGLGLRPLVARCHLGLGRLRRRIGNATEAQEHFEAATAMFREMNMRFWLAQAEGELRLSGEG